MFPTDPINLPADTELQEAEHDMMLLARQRATASAEREKHDAVVKACNAKLAEYLDRLNLGRRHQLPDGALIQFVLPAPRTRVAPEKLLELGVSAAIIEQATITSPVQGYIRVDGARELSAAVHDVGAADQPRVN